MTASAASSCADARRTRVRERAKRARIAPASSVDPPRSAGESNVVT
jgi:hypothetical protein